MKLSSKIVSAILSGVIACSSLTIAAVSVSAKDEVTFDDSNVTVSFGSLSDIHYGDGYNTGNNDDKLAKAIKTFENAVGGSDKLNALAISGDLTDHGTDVEHQKIKTILDTNLAANTKLILAPGNHDAYVSGGFSSYNPFAKNYGNLVYQNPIEGNTDEQMLRGNYHTIINGVHFISVFSIDGDMQGSDAKWLDEQLKIAQEADKTKPIFVLSHVHPYQTCYGSNQLGNGNQRWQDKVGVKILKKYPQAVSFTGHTHFPVTDDSALWQEEFTSVNTGSMRYMSIEENFVETGSSQEGIDKNETVSTGQLIQLDNKGVVKITRYNLRADGSYGAQIKQPWIFKTMQSASDAKYTKESRSQIEKPSFPANTKFNVDENIIFNMASFKVNFGSAIAPADMVHHYEVEVSEKNAPANVAAIVKSYTKFFFYNDPEKDMPKEEKTLDINATNLKSETAYSLNVFAVDSFGNRSVPLSHDFTSAKFSDKNAILDFGYKSLVDFENWPVDTDLGVSSSDISSGIVFNPMLKDITNITVQKNDVFNNNVLQIKSLKSNIAQKITIDVTRKPSDTAIAAEKPAFLSFLINTDDFISPNTGIKLYYTDASGNKFIMKENAPYMVFTKDGYTNKFIAKDGITLNKQSNIRVIVPVSSFTCDDVKTSSSEAIKNMKELSFDFSSNGFRKSKIYIDDIGFLTPKNETGSIKPPLLKDEAITPPEPEIILGDVNGDTVVSTLDVLAILKHLSKIETLEGNSLIAADYVIDGTINTIDAIAILKFIAHI